MNSRAVVYSSKVERKLCNVNLVNTDKHILLPEIAFDLISMLITKLQRVSFVYCLCLKSREGERKVLNESLYTMHIG